MLGFPLVDELGNEVNAGLYGEHEAWFKRSGQTQRLETKLLGLHLSVLVAYVFLAEIFHVVHIKAHHMT